MEKGKLGVSDNDLDQMTGIFRLLSDKTRLNILMLLADGERNVTSLCEELQLPQPTVSHHLGLLRMSQVIDNRRSGKQVFYSLNGRFGIGQNEGIEVNAGNFAIRVLPRV